MKGLISICILVFGTLGGWIGASASGGNWFSAASIGLAAVGSFLGIYIGYKASQYI